MVFPLQAAHVIILMGPSCAGKSTLSKYVGKQLNAKKEKWMVVDFDEVEENIELLITKTNEYLQNNINVIIDTNTYEDEMEKELKGAATITKIIVTAPLEVLLQRDEKRTHYLQRSAQRAGVCRHFVIESFQRSLTWPSDLIIDSSAIEVKGACDLICKSLHIAASQKSSIAIRLASPEDLDAILALDISLSEYFVPLLLQYPEFEENKEAVVKLLDDEVESDTIWFASCIALENQQRLYVAQDDMAIVGFAACHLQDNTIVVIDLVLIDAYYRGKGIGKQLIKSCIEAFPQASTCMLVVLDNNELARIAYEKMGFVLMDEKPLFVQEKYSEPRYICYSLSLN